jgi:hypothetical protein
MTRFKKSVWGSALLLLYLITGAAVYFLVSTNYEVYRNPRSAVPLGSAEVVNYSTTVSQGDYIQAKRRIIDEPDNCNIHVRRYLSPTNNLNIEFLMLEEVRPSYKGVNNVKEYRTHVPENFPTGTYIYYAKLEYYCTWVQKIFGPGRFTNQPVLIKVVPKDESSR